MGTAILGATFLIPVPVSGFARRNKLFENERREASHAEGHCGNRRRVKSLPALFLLILPIAQPFGLPVHPAASPHVVLIGSLPLAPPSARPSTRRRPPRRVLFLRDECLRRG